MGKLDNRKWQKLVIAFREQPGNIKNAARVAVCDRATARRAWSVGYPEIKREPIQVLLEREAEESEVARREKEKIIREETEAFAAALRGDVRAQALEEYERTNRYLRAASATATSALVAAHKLQPAVQELGDMAPHLVEIVQKGILSGEVGAREAVSMMEKIASIMKAVSATANAATLQGAKVFEVSRARMNSDALINIEKAVNAEPFDPGEAKRLAAELAEAAAEVELWDPDKPTLNVIKGEGGQDEDSQDSESQGAASP